MFHIQEHVYPEDNDGEDSDEEGDTPDPNEKKRLNRDKDDEEWTRDVCPDSDIEEFEDGVEETNEPHLDEFAELLRLNAKMNPREEGEVAIDENGFEESDKEEDELNETEQEEADQTCTASEPSSVTDKKKQRFVSHLQYLRYDMRRTTRDMVSDIGIQLRGIIISLQTVFHNIWSIPHLNQQFIIDNMLRIFSQRFWHVKQHYTQTLKNRKYRVLVLTIPNRALEGQVLGYDG